MTNRKHAIATTLAAIIASFALAFSLTGCVTHQDVNSGAASTEGNIGFENVSEDNASNEPVQDSVAEQPQQTKPAPSPEPMPAPQQPAQPAPQSSYIPSAWSAVVAPNAYKVWGAALVDHNVNPGEYHYSSLDTLGRTQVAYAGITKADFVRELSEDREDFKGNANKISGWGHNARVAVTYPNGKQYKDYFYNRSHLIADSLGGTPSRDNLVTGSRYQNVGQDNKGGMSYCENKVRDWLKNAPESSFVYYAATPTYVGNELVPRSVFVDMLSSDGSINEHVEVFNVSGDPRVSIDYATGNILK